MKKTFLDSIIAKISDDDKIKTLDLSKLEDLNEYLETCEKLRSSSVLKMMFEIFDENFDEFIENLKTIGYKKYNESRADTQEKEECSCECQDCVCGTTLYDEEWDYNKDVKVGDYGIALDDKHYSIYMGKVTYNDDVKFTLKNPVKFTDDSGFKTEKLPFEELTLVKTLWTLDEAMDDEIDVYEGRDPFSDVKSLPSFGLEHKVKNNIDKHVKKYMEDYKHLFEEDDRNYVQDVLFEYTAYLYKNIKENK